MSNIILTEHRPDGICIITLNKPEKHNAFDEYLIANLTEKLITLDQDETVKVILLNANGKNFSAGADLEWMKKMLLYTEQENVQDALQLVKLLKTLSTIRKTTIGLAKGITMGGGIGLLCCCDIILAEQEARFCFSEAKLGLVPATIAPYVIRAIGSRFAQYYFLTAKIFSAIEARNMGLVHEIIAQNNLLDHGITVATSLLKNGPQALLIIKQLISRFNQSNDEILHETAELIAKVRISSEAQEGLAAFLEKREPEWIHRSTS